MFDHPQKPNSCDASSLGRALLPNAYSILFLLKKRTFEKENADDFSCCNNAAVAAGHLDENETKLNLVN